jgi:eukaryotic-like serine/threonine-protein kinase
MFYGKQDSMSEYVQPESNRETLGRYKILQRLGHGGMGDVWLGEDPRLHRQVAIKTLPVRKQRDHEFVERFEREARAAAALNHPHILPIHDYGRQVLQDESLITYIVMPYIRGGSLAERIVFYTQQRRLMPMQEALVFLTQAAEAIDYAHEHLIIHRDIKPENMLLRDDGWLLLADFGIARILTDAEHLTATGLGFGTASYMAPEQAKGQAVSGSDNYSLAVVAYQLFTGRLPFQAETSYATTIQHLTMPPPPPRQLNPHLSPAFAQVLLQGLAKEPAARLASASMFVKALQDTSVNTSDEATYQPTELAPTIDMLVRSPSNQDAARRETVHTEPKKPSLTRRSLLFASSGAAVLAMGGGLGVWKLISMRNPVISAHTQRTQAATRDLDAPLYIFTDFNQKVNALAWHPQQNLLAAASADDGQVITWNIALPKPSNKPPVYTQRQLLAGVDTVAWSADGKYLAMATSGTNSSVNNVTLALQSLNPRTLLLTQKSSIAIPTSNVITGLGWLQKKYLITVEFDINDDTKSFMRITDSTQPQKQWTPIPLVSTYPSLAISPDGSKVAIGQTKSVLVGNVIAIESTPKWHPLISPLQPEPTSDIADTLGYVAWSADGKEIITTNAANNEGQPAFWNWQDHKSQLQPLKMPVAASDPTGVTIRSEAIVGNPASITPGFAIGYENGAIYLWNAKVGTEPVRTLKTNRHAPVDTMAWSPDGQWLAASFEDTNASILLWKL